MQLLLGFPERLLASDHDRTVFIREGCVAQAVVGSPRLSGGLVHANMRRAKTRSLPPTAFPVNATGIAIRG